MRRGGDRAVWALLTAVLLTAAVGLLDFLTPADVDFGEFYMVPVILVAWFVGGRTGVAFALIASIVELLVDTTLRSAGAANGEAIALWNGVATLIVLTAIAFITDIVYRERERWRALDAERGMLLRVLEQELPRPLRAADWFARTFEDAFRSSITPAVRAQFAVLRHHTREAIFLATDLLALGQLRMGGLRFERVPSSSKRSPPKRWRRRWIVRACCSRAPTTGLPSSRIPIASVTRSPASFRASSRCPPTNP